MAEGEQIEKQLQLFLELINQSDDGIFIVDPDSSLFLYCNDMARNRLGYAPEELLTMRVVDIEKILPDNLNWQEHVKEVRSKGNVIIEGRHRRKDGSTFPVEVNVKFIDVENKNYMIAICRDITERKQIEETLTGKTRLIEAFFKHTITPIALLDRHFNFIRVNDAYAKAGQRDIEEFFGHNHFEFYPSDAKAIFERVVETKKLYQTIARPFIYPDHPEWGVTYWDWSLVPILDGMGEVDFLVFSLNDVTERKRAEDEILKYQKNLRSLVQRISLIEEQERKRISEALHDNLGQSLAFSKIKLKALRDSDSARDIAGELGDIEELIEQSLQFTRSLTSELSPPILFELGLEKAVEWLCDKIQEKHHVLVEVLSDGKLKEMKIEMSILLFKTVRELLTNIVKHAGAKKALVSLRRENEDTLRINVEDDGVGFDLSKIGHYENGAESFGLFNVRERINYLGGTFDIESGPGHGTRVTMVVPMKKDNKGTAK